MTLLLLVWAYGGGSFHVTPSLANDGAERNPAWTDWYDPHFFVSIIPSYAWSYTFAKDRATGSKADLYGHVNYGMMLEIGRIWNTWLGTWLEMGFLYRTGYNAVGPEAGFGFFVLGAGGSFLISEPLELQVVVRGIEKPAVRFTGLTSAAVDVGYVPELETQLNVYLMRRWDYDIHAGFKVVLDLPSKFSGSNRRLNAGTGVELTLHKNFVDFTIFTDFETGMTDTVEQYSMNIGIQLKATW